MTGRRSRKTLAVPVHFPTTGRSLLEEGVIGVLVIWGVGEVLEDAAIAVAVKGMEKERLAVRPVVEEVVAAATGQGAA